MPADQTRDIPLTAELNAFIRAQVVTGHYQNASEVVRAGLRLSFKGASKGGVGIAAARRIGVRQPLETKPSSFNFLTHGSEMGALIRAFNWAATPLGRLPSQLIEEVYLGS